MVGKLVSFWKGVCSRGYVSFQRGTFFPRYPMASISELKTNVRWLDDALKFPIEKLLVKCMFCAFFRVNQKRSLKMNDTLPETNIAPKNGVWKTTFLLGWYLFRGYVKLREGIRWIEEISGVIRFANLQSFFFFASMALPSRKLAYPTWGKGKSSSNMPYQGDMLIPWRVKQ